MANHFQAKFVKWNARRLPLVKSFQPREELSFGEISFWSMRIESVSVAVVKPGERRDLLLVDHAPCNSANSLAAQRRSSM